MKRDYEFYKSSIAGISKPFAFIDLDMLDSNIEVIKKISEKHNLRIVSNAFRSLPLLRYVLDSSENFKGILSYSAGEAAWLLENNFDDILIAYPFFNDDHIHSLANHVKAGKNLSICVDSERTVHHLNTRAEIENVTFDVCIDLDISYDLPGLHFGVWRSSVRTDDELRHILDKIKDASHLKIKGMLAFDVEISRTPDRLPGKLVRNSLTGLLKKLASAHASSRILDSLRILKETNPELPIVNSGGTGSLLRAKDYAGVNELSCGSGFLCPRLCDFYEDLELSPAAIFALEVTRRPSDDIYTCQGGGYLASGTGEEVRWPSPYLPIGASLESGEGAGSTQTPVIYEAGEKIALGDPIFFRHAKSGELMEHFNELILLRNGKIEDRIKTYRGEGKAFG